MWIILEGLLFLVPLHNNQDEDYILRLIKSINNNYSLQKFK